MSDAYRCDGCDGYFDGEPPFQLRSIAQGDYDGEYVREMIQGDYCSIDCLVTAQPGDVLEPWRVRRMGGGTDE